MGGLENSIWASKSGPVFKTATRAMTSACIDEPRRSPSAPAAASSERRAGARPRPSPPSSQPPPRPATVAITPAMPLDPPHAKGGSGGGGSGRSPPQELDRYTRIVARMNWKIPALDHGYFQATTATALYAAGQCSQAEAAHQVMMFKLDFYEFYMLIERALVHLLGVFGIAVSGQAAARRSGIGSAAAHTYHHNVLTALDSMENPLRPALGGATAARKALGRAKELRNRWKYVEEQEGSGGSSGGVGEGRGGDGGGADGDEEGMRLEQYELRSVIETISAGFADAHGVAREWMDRIRAQDGNDNSEDEEDEDWSFMVEAMDWEAV